jgi:hypothetical protein
MARRSVANTSAYFYVEFLASVKRGGGTSQLLCLIGVLEACMHDGSLSTVTTNGDARNVDGPSSVDYTQL